VSEQSNSDHCRTIAEIKVGGTVWRVDSDCGVVKLHSSRDGCMAALNAVEARRLSGEFAQALTTAAWSVERASKGGVR
jgi:hypothetical protein